MSENNIGKKNQYGYTVYQGMANSSSVNVSIGNADRVAASDEMHRFNWGAFFFNFIWAFFNGAYVQSFIYIGVVFFLNIFNPFISSLAGLGLCIWFGINGNEWAWKNKSWKSLDYFYLIQRRWAMAILIYLITIIAFIFISVRILTSNPELLKKILDSEYIAKIEASRQAKIEQLQGEGIQSSKENSLLKNMGTVRYSIKNIPDNVVNYLETSDKYSRFNDGKKLVISFSVPNCPYASATKSIIDQAKGMDYYNSAYNFYQLSGNRTEYYRDMDEAKAGHKLYDLCGQFCVINLSNNQIFSFPVLRTEQVNKVGSVLQQLHDW